jgi:hypothetical protein
MEDGLDGASGRAKVAMPLAEFVMVVAEGFGAEGG